MASVSNSADSNSDLLAAAFSSALGCNIVHKAHKDDLNFIQKMFDYPVTNQKDIVFGGDVTLSTLYRTSLSAYHCGDGESGDKNDAMEIKVKTLTGKSATFKCHKSTTVFRLKSMIEEEKSLRHKEAERIHPNQQRLIFRGLQLEDDRRLADYNVCDGSVLDLILRLRGGAHAVFYTLDDKLLDPPFDFDFTTINDAGSGRSFSRGGERYVRPCGYHRSAIKVSDKFGDTIWLGDPGDREHSCKDEWPVSYHGTGYNNGLSIAKEGYQLSRGVRFKYGYGIYSTPDFTIAEQYAKGFDWKGSHYKLLIQNRINPVELQKIQFTNGMEYWLSQNETDLRVYGLLIKKL